MIVIKSVEEILLMKEAGAVTAEILHTIPEIIRPGITTKALDEYIEKFILDKGMIPAFKGYNGFPASACISVNDEVVHGIPSETVRLKEGDIVSVDVGTIYKGYYSDAARTYPVGTIEDKAQKLIDVTRESFYEGLKYCYEGKRLSEVSRAIQNHIESNGFSVVRDFVGHGIGRNMHEEPQIPNYVSVGRGPMLEAGMALAIEPMVNEGGWQVMSMADNWTIKTKDGSLSAHYENTVVITPEEPLILTEFPEER